MKPLVLREIADELGLHESTISRVTTAKYMATPWGTFELKYFFGSGLNTEAGGEASSTAVRALIKQFVAAEDAKKPLSDSALAAMLEEQGIQCARRTVAKYREALRIPSSVQRRREKQKIGADRETQSPATRQLRGLKSTILEMSWRACPVHRVAVTQANSVPNVP